MASATDGGTVLALAIFVYDGLGNRVKQDEWTQASGTTTVTRFSYDGDEVWADLSISSLPRWLRAGPSPGS